MAHLRAQALQQRQIFDITINPGDIFTSALGDVTSGFGDITSRIGAGASSVLSPLLPPRPTLTSDTNTASLSSTATVSLSASQSSSTSLSVSSSDSALSATSSDIPSLTPSLPESSTTTITSIVQASPTVKAAASEAPKPKGFLDNKPLAGFVFGLIGLIALVVIFTLVTFAMRRRRNKRLLREAIDFEPQAPHGGYGDDMDRALTEKTRRSSGSDGGYGYGSPNNSSYAGGYGQYPAGSGYQTSTTSAQPYTFPTYTLPSQLNRQYFDGDHQQIMPDNPATTGASYGGLTFQSPAATQGFGQVPVAGPLPDTFGSNSRPALKIANM